MKKKLLSLALAVVMVCGLAVPVSAVESYYEANLEGMATYYFGIGDMDSYNRTMKELEEYRANNADSDFTIVDGVLTKYKGSGGKVVIPDGVTKIEVGAFMDCATITSVTVPDSVTSIGMYAFYGCTGLTSVTIPDSVTSIENRAFLDCTSLTSVTIPNSVTSIGGQAFDGCTGLTSVTIGNGVTSIGSSAFSGCTSLTSVTIPDSVTSIGSSAFSGCTGLTSVTISDSVTSIGNNAFSGCTSLTSVTIGNSVTSIGGQAFDGCFGLTNVTIPDSVTSIGYYAFLDCTGLTDVYYGGTEEQWKAIDMGDANDPLTSATIHYNSAAPAVPTAYPSTQTVDADGKAIEFQCYALKDANGNDTNYIKLRDLADILNGSAVQFQVGWDGQVTITTGKGYTKNGSEQNTPFSGQRAYQEVTAQTMVDGKAADLAAFTLTDDNGGGYTYYKLRDLGDALGFKVDWSAQRGIFIETK